MRRRGCKRRGDERMRVAVIMLTTRVVSEHSTHVGRGCSSEHAPLEAAPTVAHSCVSNHRVPEHPSTHKFA